MTLKKTLFKPASVAHFRAGPRRYVIDDAIRLLPEDMWAVLCEVLDVKDGSVSERFFEVSEEGLCAIFALTGCGDGVFQVLIPERGPANLVVDTGVYGVVELDWLERKSLRPSPMAILFHADLGRARLDPADDPFLFALS